MAALVWRCLLAVYLIPFVLVVVVVCSSSRYFLFRFLLFFCWFLRYTPPFWPCRPLGGFSLPAVIYTTCPPLASPGRIYNESCMNENILCFLWRIGQPTCSKRSERSERTLGSSVEVCFTAVWAQLALIGRWLGVAVVAYGGTGLATSICLYFVCTQLQLARDASRAR